MRKARDSGLWLFLFLAGRNYEVIANSGKNAIRCDAALEVEMTWLFKWLVPCVPLVDLPPMIALAVIGAAIAGSYGFLHDLATYAISPEYFTKMKFDQFRYADLGCGDRFFAGTIGFIASWWVGAVSAWFLARRQIPNQPRTRAYRLVLQGFLCVLAITLLCGGLGYLLGLARGPDADYSSWGPMVRSLGIDDHWAFIRVAYIHGGSYLGALLGLLVALLLIPNDRPAVASPAKTAKTSP